MRPKRNITEQGIWPLVQSEALKFVERWPENVTFDVWRDLMPLAQAAHTPEILKAGGEDNDLRRDFCRLCADYPDFALAFVQEVRRILRKTDSNFLVQKYILLNDTHALQDGEIAMEVEKLAGKPISTAAVKKARQSLGGTLPKQVWIGRDPFPPTCSAFQPVKTAPEPKGKKRKKT